MDDEIDLIDLWFALANRRWWIAGAFFVVVAASIAYLAVATRTYATQFTLEIGHVSSQNSAQVSVPIESTPAFISSLKAQYGAGHSGISARKLPRVTSVTSQDGGSELVTITAQGSSPVQVAQFLSKVASTVMNQQKKLYTNAVSMRKRYLKRLRHQREQINVQIANIDQQLRQTAATSPATTLSLLANRASLFQQRASIGAEIDNMEQSLAAPLSQSTRLLNAPPPPNHPSWPKSKLVLTLGVLGGLIAGLMAALLAAFCERVRIEKQVRHAKRSPLGPSSEAGDDAQADIVLSGD